MRRVTRRKRTKNEIAVALAAWRKRNKRSQSKAALKLKVSVRTLQEWEQDRSTPRHLALEALRNKIVGLPSGAIIPPETSQHAIRESRTASVAEAKIDGILGAHILHHFASELIAEADSLSLHDALPIYIGRTCHSHPTL